MTLVRCTALVQPSLAQGYPLSVRLALNRCSTHQPAEVAHLDGTRSVKSYFVEQHLSSTFSQGEAGQYKSNRNPMWTLTTFGSCCRASARQLPGKAQIAAIPEFGRGGTDLTPWRTHRWGFFGTRRGANHMYKRQRPTRNTIINKISEARVSDAQKSNINNNLQYEIIEHMAL